MLPSGSQRPRSPVRYSRAPGSPPNASGTNFSAVSSGRFRYPRPTPAPPMYSSPATPTGAGSPSRSKMYICVFAIGRPIGVNCRANSGMQRYALAQIVASVGPYSLNSDTEGKAWNDLLSSDGRHGSPPTITLEMLLYITLPAPYSSMYLYIEGTHNKLSISKRATYLANCKGSRATSSDGIYKVPKFVRQPKIAAAELSNGNGEMSKLRPRLPYILFLARVELTKFRCVTITPFGSPVEPDV